MADSTTLTLRLSTELKAKLDRLAMETRRSKSFLAAEALETYVAHELDIVDGIKRGLADMAAGRGIPHEQAMAEIDQTIERAIAAQAERPAKSA